MSIDSFIKDMDQRWDLAGKKPPPFEAFIDFIQNPCYKRFYIEFIDKEIEAAKRKGLASDDIVDVKVANKLWQILEKIRDKPMSSYKSHYESDPANSLRK